jgi:hypothetical protein
VARPLYQGNCNYTPISTLGTLTLSPGPASVEPGYYGAFYGFNVINSGTATTSGMVCSVYDVQQVVTGTGTNTVTNTLMSGTATGAGQVLAAAPGELGIRYKGSLIIITTGTACGVNALWD